MAFVQQVPRAFTRQNVEGLRPSQVGVYGLFNQGGWVYVGKGDIRERLLAHLTGDNPTLLRYQPTHWVDEVTPGDPSVRERHLILELQPACNQRVG